MTFSLSLILGAACAISGASLFIFFDRYESRFSQRRLISLLGFGFMLIFGGLQMTITALGWDSAITQHAGSDAWRASLLVVTFGTCFEVLRRKNAMIKARRRHG